MDYSNPLVQIIKRRVSGQASDSSLPVYPLSVFRIFVLLWIAVVLISVPSSNIYSLHVQQVPADTMKKTDSVIVVTTPIPEPKLKEEKPVGFRFHYRPALNMG